jgi:SAM-dependent methyltransferase
MAIPLSWASDALTLARKAARRAIARGAELRYDRTLGIDTGGEITGKHLMTPPGSAAAKGYAGTPPEIAERLIGWVVDRARGFTFIDYGAGKGRVLLIAARHPFERVVGIELSEPLIRIASANVAAYRLRHPELCAIELIQADALDYVLPQTPCVLFFYDPFEAGLMARIGQKVRESFIANPRKLFIIYYSPAYPDAFEAPFMQRHDITDLSDGPMNRYGKQSAAIFETLP